MSLKISQPAARWFVKEMGLEQGQALRFFVRVGGCADVGDGFSIGVSVESPRKPIYIQTIESNTFFIETDDEWFFQQRILNVKYKRKQDDIDYVTVEKRT